MDNRTTIGPKSHILGVIIGAAATIAAAYVGKVSGYNIVPGFASEVPTGSKSDANLREVEASLRSRNEEIESLKRQLNELRQQVKANNESSSSRPSLSAGRIDEDTSVQNSNIDKKLGNFDSLIGRWEGQSADGIEIKIDITPKSEMTATGFVNYPTIGNSIYSINCEKIGIGDLIEESKSTYIGVGRNYSGSAYFKAQHIKRIQGSGGGYVITDISSMRILVESDKMKLAIFRTGDGDSKPSVIYNLSRVR